MEKTQASQQEESKTGPLPQLMAALQITGIPKTGQSAYDYDDSRTDNLIGRGGFGNVFRAIRIYDKQTFAIKVAKDK